jgi:hypothetical protein
MAWGQEGDGVCLSHCLLTRGIGGKTGSAIGQKMHHAAVGGSVAIQVARLKAKAQFCAIVARFDQINAHLNRRGVIGPKGLHGWGDLFGHCASIS